MNYDKNSFLSGVAVGRQLKGWSAYGVIRTDIRDPSVWAVLSNMGYVDLTPTMLSLPHSGFGGSMITVSLAHINIDITPDPIILSHTGFEGQTMVITNVQMEAT